MKGEERGSGESSGREGRERERESEEGGKGEHTAVRPRMTHGKAMIELETPKLIQRPSLFAFNCKTIGQQNNIKK